eukprot:2013312-Rhodomonas_salina.2
MFDGVRRQIARNDVTPNDDPLHPLSIIQHRNENKSASPSSPISVLHHSCLYIDRSARQTRWCDAWSGLVWSGLVWSGLVWSGLVWLGLVRGRTTRVLTWSLILPCASWRCSVSVLFPRCSVAFSCTCEWNDFILSPCHRPFVKTSAQALPQPRQYRIFSNQAAAAIIGKPLCIRPENHPHHPLPSSANGPGSSLSLSQHAPEQQLVGIRPHPNNTPSTHPHHTLTTFLPLALHSVLLRGCAEHQVCELVLGRVFVGWCSVCGLRGAVLDLELALEERVVVSDAVVHKGPLGRRRSSCSHQPQPQPQHTLLSTLPRTSRGASEKENPAKRARKVRNAHAKCGPTRITQPQK